MPTPKGSGLGLPVGDTASITVSALPVDEQRKAVRKLLTLVPSPADARQALDALGLTDFARALAASRATTGGTA